MAAAAVCCCPPDLELAGVADADEVTKGGFVAVNDDDDNGNDAADKNESGSTAGEDDLLALTVRPSGGLGTLTLECLTGCGQIAVFETLGRSGRVTLPKVWSEPTTQLPRTYYVEGVSPSSAAREVELVLRFEGAEGSCEDRVRLTVYQVDTLEWQVSAAAPDNPALTPCPNNGGNRMFPDWVSPGDNPNPPDRRRKVDLVATIKPAIQGRTVYFKVWDVDDPFDQLNATMPDVGLIDSSPTSGPDNRGTGWNLSAPSGTTDGAGKARVTLTVSMQPGDNFRAGASAVSDPTGQVDQTKADAADDSFTGQPGNFDGYKVPLRWSRMLTVWRKLHVERDTMQSPELSATQVVGTAVSIALNTPVAGQSVVDLGQNLPNEFSDLNLYEGGQIVFASCPIGSDTYPVLLSTSNVVANDTVTVSGLPGICATSSVYILTDDDDISVLPHFPDFGTIGINAFAAAYVLPEDAGAAFQTAVGFDRHLDDTEIEYGTSPWDDGCTVPSSAAYWACCVVGCWEPSQNMDYDPDPCPGPAVPGSEGKDGGITDDDSGTSAIFLQVIADDFACTFSSDEMHIVTHEIVHTSNSHPQHIPGSIMDDGAPRGFAKFSSETLVIIRQETEW